MIKITKIFGIILLLILGLLSLRADSSRLEGIAETENQLTCEEIAQQLKEQDIKNFTPLVPLCIEQLDSEEMDVQIQAAICLGRAGSEEGIDILAEHLIYDPEKLVREQCAKALGYIESEMAIPFLIDALSDPEKEVRLASAISLSAIGEKEYCLGALTNVLDDEDRNIRMKSLKGLRNIGSSEAISLVETSLNDEDVYVKVDAAILLADLGEYDSALPVLYSLMDSEDKYIRLASLRGLSKIRNLRAILVIRNALNDSDGEVRGRAKDILQGLGKGSDSELLMEKEYITTSSTYDPQAAANYADTWWNGRNPAYHDYGDNDCANFVSQCLIAGGLSLSAGPGVDSWGCIPYCDNLHLNLVNSQGATHERKNRGESEPIWFVKGDPALFGNYSDYWTHAVFAVTGDASNYCQCNAHSYNQYHQTISWFFQVDPNFDVCNYYHILSIPIQTPTVETRPATSVTNTGAILNGRIVSNGGSSIIERRFSWGTTPSCSDDWTANVSVSGDYFSYYLYGLNPGTTYYFQAWAKNSEGWSQGEVLSFQTSGTPPSVTTNVATNIGQTSATLNSTVNPNGSSTTVYYDYGLTTSYGSSVTYGNIGSGTTGLSLPMGISSLQCNTTYHFRARATNSGGTTNGNDRTFTTSACTQSPPSVTTNVATNIGQTSATLNSTVNPNGSSTTVYYDYGLTTSYGSSVTYGNIGSGTTGLSLPMGISSLQCNTTYHFRARATNSGGTTNGNDRTFTTGEWETAYNTLFDSRSDLELLRQYRDEILSKTTKGKMYKTLLYMSSEEALEVLLDNPELILEAKNLIEANKNAVSEVLNGNEGVLYNTDEIISFLDAYADKSPPALKILANMMKSDMLRKQSYGKLFLGFELK